MRRWLGTLFLIAACSGDGGNGPVPFAGYITALNGAYCDYLARCGLFPDVATCESANIGITFDVDPSTAAAVAMGTIDYDASLAGQCLDALGSTTCDQTQSRAEPAVCEQFVHGTVGSGGTCALDAECTSQLCDLPSCSMACCQGTCTGDVAPVPGGSGMPCSATGECTAANYCDDATTTCTPLLAAGSACDYTGECAVGLGCSGTPTTCKQLPGTGQPCPDNVCADIGDHCGSAGTCVAVGLAGSACASSADCSQFYPCDATNHCAKGPGTGQACTDSQSCFDNGTYCNTGSATPTCVPLGSDGAACEYSEQCQSDTCGSAGTCTTSAVCI